MKTSYYTVIMNLVLQYMLVDSRDGIPSTIAQVETIPSFCSSSKDCSEAGICNITTDVCVCDAGFRGERCESLDLTGVATRTIINIPNLHLNKTIISTVWGGHSLSSDAKAHEFHWFGSAIRDGDPLSKWATNSVISHAVTKSPSTYSGYEGPFNLDNIIFQPDGRHSWDSGSLHGVYALRNPSPWPNASDTWLIFFTGYAAVSKPLATRQIGVAFSPTLTGPWTKWHQPVFSANTNKSAPDSSSVSNAAPAFTSDGSGRILLAYKGLGAAQPSHPVCTDGSGRPCIFIASAPHWSGPYEHVTANLHQIIEGEDPTLWQDQRGGWHMLFEKYVDHGIHGVGAHAFSTNGLHDWKITPSSTWFTTILKLDGVNTTLTKRERPQLVFDFDFPHRPVALFNGACTSTKNCFNIVMDFN